MAREQPGKQAADGDQRCSEYNFEVPIKFNLPAFRASQVAEQFVRYTSVPGSCRSSRAPRCFGKRFPLDRPRALPQGAR